MMTGRRTNFFWRPFCRINAAFHLATERRIYAAPKNCVVRHDDRMVARSLYPQCCGQAGSSLALVCSFLVFTAVASALANRLLEPRTDSPALPAAGLPSQGGGVGRGNPGLRTNMPNFRRRSGGRKKNWARPGSRSNRCYGIRSRTSGKVTFRSTVLAGSISI